jgi:ribosome biogenesis GTPase
LIRLRNGALIIDTPGMRELGMWDISEGLGEAFRDIDDLAARCRFSDCGHGREPGCAIKAALASGELPHARWDNYQQLKKEARYSDDKTAFMRAKKEWGKSIAKKIKQMK